MRKMGLGVVGVLAAAVIVWGPAAWAVPVAFRIGVQPGGQTSLYTNSSDLVAGDPVYTNLGGTGSGTFDLAANDPTYMHIHGQRSGGGYMAAHFTAPPGYAFEETGNWYAFTNHDVIKQAGRALWSASPFSWASGNYGPPWNPVQSIWPASYVGDADGTYVPGTEEIWDGAGQPDTYFTTRLTLVRAGPVPPADPNISPNPVDMGHLRVGDPGLEALTVANVAPAGSAWLNASFGLITPDVASATGSVTWLPPGGSDGTTMMIGIDTSSVGEKAGTAQVDARVGRPGRHPAAIGDHRRHRDRLSAGDRQPRHALAAEPRHRARRRCRHGAPVDHKHCAGRPLL